MANHRVVVTGLGVITPIGNSVPEFWTALTSGVSGMGPITKFDTSKHKVRFAAEVKNYNAENYFDKKEARQFEPFVQFSVIAAREAMKDSGIDVAKVGAENIGVYIGSGIGGLSVMEEETKVLLEKGPDRVSPRLIPRLIANMAPGQTSISLGLRGPNSCVVTACATGTHAIGDAFNIVRRGQAVAMLAGGTESAITPLGIAGFANMHALSRRNDSPATASRPFSKDRDGFVMGEGAGVMLLEEYEHAKARGAKIYGEVVGYGFTADAHHITAPAPEGEGAQRSMRMALKDAEMKPTEIDYVNAHGTSTELNDKLETIAMKHVFGEHAYKFAASSNKSMTGHLLGAAGGVEGVASLLSIHHQIAPPTINYSEKDPDCDLDYITEGARKMKIAAVMSNSFGFGGHNATVIFRKV
ncbi:beta-ketoacyl-ACP synthase II [Candidatus Sumerlaeota bacterium]|nr:beta-ketoacyl-ACP synthase II [Candidatus Sumerlaeota bacterium]